MGLIRHRAVGLLIFVLVLGSGVAVAVSEAAGLEPRRVTEGTLLWRTALDGTLVPAPVLDTDVDLQVTGTIARATVRQTFTNPSAEWAEGLYVFPLPDDAAVDHLRMQVGERTIEGLIQMTALFRKLESPALTDVRLELPGVVLVEAFPDQIPDLYVGEPIVVSLRASALPEGAVLRGRLGGMEWQRELSFQQAAEGTGIAVHWARAKIAALLDTRRSATEAETRRAVIDVAMKHHLVSRYTSLVAVDVTRVRPGDAGLHRHALETNLPHGWEYTAVFGLGQGATGATMHVIVGAIALVAAATMYLLLRHDIALARPRRDGHGA